MKLWNKEDSLDKKIENFTVGKDRLYDVYLAKYDVIASIAHAKMLKKVNILTSIEYKKIEYELNKILEQINSGKYASRKTWFNWKKNTYW